MFISFQLWNNETAVELLTTFYPDFYPIWANYKYPIQRADSIRYFILAHHGGIYIDLDNVNGLRLLSLLSQPFPMAPR